MNEILQEIKRQNNEIQSKICERRVPPDEDAQLRTILDANRAHVQRLLDEARGDFAGVAERPDRFDQE